MLMGGIISFSKFKILNEKNMAHATSIMSVALVILIAVGVLPSGPPEEKNHSGRWCAGSAGSGHFIGTIMLGLPLAIMLGMGREAVGATYSVGCEPNIAIIEEAKYGLVRRKAAVSWRSYITAVRCTVLSGWGSSRV